VKRPEKQQRFQFSSSSPSLLVSCPNITWKAISPHRLLDPRLSLHPNWPHKPFVAERSGRLCSTLPLPMQSSPQSDGVTGLRCHCWRVILGAGCYPVSGNTLELRGHALPTSNAALLKQKVNQSNDHSPQQLPGATRCSLRTWLPSITHSNCPSTNRIPATNKY